MMRHVLRSLGLIAIVTLFFAGCATHGRVPAPFEAQPIESGKYNQKVDHLYFILDASSSMTEGHAGRTKFDIASSVVENFNRTMPDIDANVAMRSFGHAGGVSKKSSALMVEPFGYQPDSLSGGLAKVSRAGGISQLDRALEDTANDLKDVKEPIALVIVSDGKDLPQKTIAAAKALARTHGEQLCIYTVQTGNDAGANMLLSQIANATGCGKVVNADSLASGSAMNAFVKDVALGELADSDGDGVVDDKDKCPNTPGGVKVDMSGCPLDSDNDGVLDHQDRCPGTQLGVKVDADGCPVPVPTKRAEVTAAGTWLYKDIQFEVNKSDLKASSYPTLNEIVDALNTQPGLKIEIQGHTDNTGDRDYNLDLSLKRARSVRSYLISRGVDGSRMTSRGYGPDRPIESNTTKQGRARNRRVEINPLR
ncbi:MAG: OmpA family protein [Desulfobacteraceae bacterium]